MTKLSLIIFSFLPILFLSQQICTLEDCIAYAENNNLTNVQARINTAIQKKRFQISEREKLPSVSGSMNNSFNFGQNVILRSLQRSDNFSHSINAGGGKNGHQAISKAAAFSDHFSTSPNNKNRKLKEIIT